MSYPLYSKDHLGENPGTDAFGSHLFAFSSEILFHVMGENEKKEA